tara:strand:- start:647 stop:1012 length:366 start_codon:yes stop_codon:yes gene_type:complete
MNKLLAIFLLFIGCNKTSQFDLIVKTCDIKKYQTMVLLNYHGKEHIKLQGESGPNYDYFIFKNLPLLPLKSFNVSFAIQQSIDDWTIIDTKEKTLNVNDLENNQIKIQLKNCMELISEGKL